MSERLQMLRITERESHWIGLLLYADWLEMVVRVWPDTLLGSADVSNGDWERLCAAHWPAMVATDVDWNQGHPGSLLAHDRSLAKLLTELPGHHFRLHTGARDKAGIIVGGGLGLDRNLHRSLCERDADCDRRNHTWLALPAENNIDMLIWHINHITFDIVPPTPLRLIGETIF